MKDLTMQDSLVVASGEIRGSKWNDTDGDSTWDAGEVGLAGWTIYLDSNENGQRDEGEVSTVTDADGNYAFTGLNAGTYTVAEVLQSGWVQTSPFGLSGKTTQLTVNIGSGFFYLDISGNNVVWKDTQGIYYYNGSSITQLTDNNLDDRDLQISGNNVVWRRYYFDRPYSEIYYYNGSSTIQLTNNNFDERYPQISGNNVVWEGSSGNDTEIYYYNGSSTIQLTDNDFNDSFPQISGNNVVWSGYDGNDSEIYYYNGSSVLKLTDNDFNDSPPQISGNNVVWESSDGNDTEIYYYNGSSVIQLTNNNISDHSPQISGNNIIWFGYNGNDHEIYYYNGSSVLKLTGDGFDNNSLQISDNTIAWLGVSNGDIKIFVTSVEAVSHTVQLASGEGVEGINFGNQQLLSSEIQGMKWNDLDGDGVQDEGELGLSGWTIFLDTDSDGVLDEGEISTTTDINGHYVLTVLDPGTYTVAEVLQAGWLPTFPDRQHTVEISYNQVIQDINFGNQVLIPGEIRGSKWNDTDGDKVRDAGETGLPGWTIYLDSNENGQRDEGEVSTVTDADGNYAFTGLTLGNYTVAEVPQHGWEQTFPGFSGGITQLTDNSFNDSSPQISGNNVAWRGSDANPSSPYFTIYYYDGSSVIEVNRNLSNSSPQISGNNIVWSGGDVDFRYKEIYYYNGSSVLRLTYNSNYDFSPQISGNNIVWYGPEVRGSDEEIYYYNGSSVIQLTDNDFNDHNPQISGNNIVWSGYDGNDYEIYYYNGSSVTQLTDNDFNESNLFDESYLQISGNNVVWSASNGNDYEIYYYNGSSVLQLTDNDFDDRFLQISGNNIVWSGSNGNDTEIYYYNGSSIIQLTDNDFDDYSPQISGNKVVWYGYDGNDTEIYYYNGSSVLQLTDNDFDDSSPQISENNIVWEGSDGNDYEIFATSVGAVSHTVQLANGEIAEEINFGNQVLMTNEIRGNKWHDRDGDGVRDANESGLARWTIFLDTDNDGVLDAGETSTTTDANGNYTLTNVNSGTHTVAEVLKAGWEATQPRSGKQTVEVGNSEIIEGINFGNRLSVQTFNGTAGNDNLTGRTPGRDMINGRNGQDTLKGGGDADTLNGGAGDDSLNGGEGTDQLNGGNGNDTLTGGTGNNQLNGGNDNDTLTGGTGSDTLNGGAGNDVLIGVNPNNKLAGKDEIDTLTGNLGNDTFVLGNTQKAYYNDGQTASAGLADYGLITGFKVGEDVIQLHSNAEQYVLDSSPFGGSKNTAIFLKTEGENELIGLVKNVNLTALDLNSASFSFV